MTKNNYKPVCVQRTGRRLGDYIKKVNVRNTENLELPLMGLTIDKKFIPSVANTIGTDLTKYKIVYKNQFACSLMQVSRDGKMPIARLDEEAVIMSPAYPIFKVTKPEVLLPEYLEMWFKREEFDREAAFYAVGGVRGNLTWEDFCDLTLPIPSIEKQREIVADYQAVENKIKTNEAICEKLEETAQTIYRRWFEEFEFPYDFAQGKPDEEGKPYKSNGGEMVWNEGLEKEVPKGWNHCKLKKYGSIITGKTPSSKKPEDFGEDFQFITPGDFIDNKFIIESNRKLSEIGKNRLKNKILPAYSVMVTCIGSDMGKTSINKYACITNQQINSLVPHEDFYTEFLFCLLRQKKKQLKSIAIGGSTMPMLSKGKFQELIVLKPSEEAISLFHNLVKDTSENISNLLMQNQKLHQLQALLLGRMTREEN